MDGINNFVMGSVFCALSLLFFLMNGVMFWIIHRSKEFKTNTFHIIKVINVGCMMQLCSHFIGGVMAIIQRDLEFYVERITGAWLKCGWFIYQGASLALAVDRALIFLTKTSDQISAIVCWSMLGFTFCLGLVNLVILLLPGFGFQFRIFDWFYTSEGGSMILLSAEMVINFTIMILILLLYLVVFAALIRTRRMSEEAMSSVRERRILIVSFSSFFYECTYLLFYFWGVSMLSKGLAASATVTVLWIIDVGFFAISTLVVSSLMRKKLYHLVTGKKEPVAVTRISPATRVHSEISVNPH